MLGKKKLAAVVAEFLGVAILSMAVFTVAARSSFPFFPAMVAGLVVGIMVLVIGSASGAHLNPAVTFGLWSIRKFPTTDTLIYIAAQLLGGLVGWKVIEFLIDQQTQHIADWGLDARVLAAEVLGGLVFTFGVAAAVYKVYEGGKLAATIGGSLAVGILVASIAGNGIVNPAVAIGLNSVSWAYMAGPLLGGVIGMSLYALLFAPTPVRAVAATSARKTTAKKSTTKKNKRK